MHCTRDVLSSGKAISIPGAGSLPKTILLFLFDS